MQFWLWFLSGAGAQRARDWKPVRLRNLSLKAVLGEIDCFMRFWPWYLSGGNANCAARNWPPPRRAKVRRPVNLHPVEWLFCGLSWGIGGAFLAHWLFG
jgi:hypothetical protein